MLITKSKFITKNQYQRIADLYGLGKLRKIKHFKKGFEATKAAIFTSRGKFVVSQYQLVSKMHPIIKKTKNSLQFEIDLANSLRNLPVNRYLKSKNGLFIENYLNSYLMVCNYLPGEHPKSINLKRVYELGKFLGSFHQQGKNFKKEYPDRRKYCELTPDVAKQMDKYALKQKHPVLKKALPEIRNGIREFYLPASLPRGPIHVDVKPDNELFIGDKLSGILDFGISYIGPLVLDVGKGILWNCVDKGIISRVRLREFLKGYFLYRILTGTEKKNLKKSILFGIYASIYADLFHIHFGRAPEKYCLFMVKEWFPLAKWIKNNFNPDKI